MCSGNGGHGAADLEPKLDLILWLGSLGLTCQGLLGFSAAFFKRMLLVVLCVHVDPVSVPGWQVGKRSARGEGAELVGVASPPSPSLTIPPPPSSPGLSTCVLPPPLPAAAEEKTAGRCKPGSQSGADSSVFYP